jgi:serine-type D-Ala-D-Ala carboxypeptidase (penicillin-binding protein 5/6)
MSAHPRPLRRFSPIAKALVVAGSAAIITATGAMTGGADAFASPPPSPTSAVQIDTQGGAPLPPTVPAWTWAVVDADTGDLVAGRDWHWPLPSASTLKTLTAYTLINRLQLDSTYRAMPSDANAEGSHVGLIAGSHYSVRDLMHGMLMPSGNDAAMALAHAYGGVGPTTAAMNAEAA